MLGTVDVVAHGASACSGAGPPAAAGSAWQLRLVRALRLHAVGAVRGYQEQ